MNISFAPKFYWAANWHLNVEWTTTISHLNVQLTKSICIVTISHRKMNQTKLFQRLCIVTISHQKWICNAFAFFATCSEFCCESVTNKSHFWCENVTNLVPDRYNKKWFGAKTRYFFGRKRDVLYCQNVNIWCEFETFYVSHEFNFYGLSLYVSLNFHNFI